MNKIPTWLVGRFEVDPETECWLWLGNVLDSGYGQLYVSGVGPQLVHRLAHECMIGPIPKGHHVDHVYAAGCRHKHCMNPDHLEAVTASVNTQRYHELNLVCSKGHPRLDLYIAPDGRKRCRQCRRDNHARWVRDNPERARDLMNASQRRRRAA